MNATAYLRVSSRQQDAASQRSAIEHAASARGDKIVDWYSEKRSGKTIQRPELDRLRSAVTAGHVRRVYVFKIDRLTRSGIRDTFEIVEELRAHDCELVSVADGFSLSGPAAEVVLAVMAWAARMERLAINERIAAARDRLGAEGRGWGRPSRLTNADRDRAQAMRQSGMTVREISVAMRVPKTTIARALSRNVHAAGHPENA